MSETRDGGPTALPARGFRYNGLVCQVSVPDAADLVWLEEFLIPAFEPLRAERGNCTVTLTTDTRRYAETCEAGGPGGETVGCFTLDAGLVRLPLWGASPSGLAMRDPLLRVFYVLDLVHRDVEVLSMPANRAARTALMRVVREFAMTHSWKTGGLVLHAASVAVDEQAVILAGPRNAGKTSLLTYLLGYGAASFIANDRTVVLAAAPWPTVRGMPTIVNLRPSMLGLFPELGALVRRTGYHHSLSVAETLDGGRARPLPSAEGAGLTPGQYCHAVGVGARSHAVARALVFPRVTGEVGGIRLAPLTPDVAASRLAGALVAGGQPEQMSAVFDVAPDRPRPSRAEVERACLALAATVRSFECLLGLDAYRERAAAEIFLHATLG
jgi:hypothetical protein